MNAVRPDNTKAIRRNALLLAGIAAVFFFGFILLGVMRA